MGKGGGDRRGQQDSGVDTLCCVVGACSGVVRMHVLVLRRFDFFDSLSNPPLSTTEFQQHLDSGTASRAAGLRTPSRFSSVIMAAFTRELAHLAR